MLAGVLVDVSGSMKSSLKLHVESNDENITRAQSIFTTIMNIVEREVNFQQNHDVFVLAFGLEDIPTCDLLSLLEYVQGDESEARNYGDGHDNLIELLKNNGAPYAGKYIRKYVSKQTANFLFRFYSRVENRQLLHEAVERLPRICKENGFVASATKGALWTSNVFGLGYSNNVSREEARVEQEMGIAMFSAKSEILEKLKEIENPQSKTFQSTVCLLNKIAGGSSGTSAYATRNRNGLTSAELSELIESIEPFIYGGTPMCRAIQLSLSKFQSSRHEHKVLFVLSDGQSTDGNPTKFVQDLCNQKVIVFACLLTSENISHARQLHYETDPKWTKAHREMFELSSIVENSHPAMSILLEQGWELSAAGESRLFIQANHPDVIKEFSNIIQYMAEGNHVLLNMIERVSLDMYINKANSGFKPRQQHNPTCYAYAVATVFHLAMCRIEGREGGVPDFDDIYERLVKAYENKEAHTNDVLEKFAHQYRLRYRVVDELGARQAINQRRPVVTTFRLRNNQWNAFDEFYQHHPKDVLNRSHLGSPDLKTDLIGHAVVLMKCNPKSLIFLNSEGASFADGGFFRVRNQETLELTFYDVYWEEEKLEPSEIQAYRAKSVAKGRDLIEKLPTGIKNIPYECPHCHESTAVHTFIIHYSDAECPKCHNHFKPTPVGLNVSAYAR